MIWYLKGWFTDPLFRLAFRWWTWRFVWMPIGLWCDHPFDQSTDMGGGFCLKCGMPGDRIEEWGVGS